MSKTNVRPTKDPATGELFQVYAPRKGRFVVSTGEALVLDPYLERRLAAGELERFEPGAPAAPSTSTRGGRTASATETAAPAAEPTTSTGA